MSILEIAANAPAWAPPYVSDERHRANTSYLSQTRKLNVLADRQYNRSADFLQPWLRINGCALRRLFGAYDHSLYEMAQRV